MQNKISTINSSASNIDSSHNSVVQLSVPSRPSSHHSLIDLSSSTPLEHTTADDYDFSDNDTETPPVFLPVQDEFAQEPITPSIHIQHPLEQNTIRDMAVMSRSDAPLHTPRTSIPTSRPRSTRSLRTRISLPSGRSLILQLDPDSEESIRNINN